MPKGSRFLAFDLLAGCEDGCSHELLLTGNLGLSVEFGSSVTKPHLLQVHAFAPASIDVDSDHMVRITRSVV